MKNINSKSSIIPTDLGVEWSTILVEVVLGNTKTITFGTLVYVRITRR